MNRILLASLILFASSLVNAQLLHPQYEIKKGLLKDVKIPKKSDFNIANLLFDFPNAPPYSPYKPFRPVLKTSGDYSLPIEYFTYEEALERGFSFLKREKMITVKNRRYKSKSLQYYVYIVNKTKYQIKSCTLNGKEVPLQAALHPLGYKYLEDPSAKLPREDYDPLVPTYLELGFHQVFSERYNFEIKFYNESKASDAGVFPSVNYSWEGFEFSRWLKRKYKRPYVRSMPITGAYDSIKYQSDSYPTTDGVFNYKRSCAMEKTKKRGKFRNCKLKLTEISYLKYIPANEDHNEQLQFGKQQVEPFRRYKSAGIRSFECIAEKVLN